MFGTATTSNAIAAHLRFGRSRICTNQLIWIQLPRTQSRHRHHRHRWLSSSSSSWSDHLENDEDPYTVLGLDRSTATADEVKRAFRALALRYHPDVNPEDDSAAQAFRRISAAYEDLQKGHHTHNRRSSSASPHDKEEEDMEDMLARLETLFRKQRAANAGADADGDGCGSCGTKSSEANADFTTRRQETTLMWNADGTGRIMRTVTTFQSTATGTRKLVQDVAVQPDTGEYWAGWHRQDGGWEKGGLARVRINDSAAVGDKAQEELLSATTIPPNFGGRLLAVFRSIFGSPLGK